MSQYHSKVRWNFNHFCNEEINNLKPLATQRYPTELKAKNVKYCFIWQAENSILVLTNEDQSGLNICKITLHLVLSAFEDQYHSFRRFRCQKQVNEFVRIVFVLLFTTCPQLLSLCKGCPWITDERIRVCIVLAVHLEPQQARYVLNLSSKVPASSPATFPQVKNKRWPELSVKITSSIISVSLKLALRGWICSFCWRQLGHAATMHQLVLGSLLPWFVPLLCNTKGASPAFN